MKYFLIFLLVTIAMIANSFWEAYAEGRNAWGKNQVGWIIKFGKYQITGYHFFLFAVMYPALLSLPLIANGWDSKLFATLLIAYLIGTVVEDFFWYVVNPKVKFREWFTEFSDYYPWIKIRNKKLIPVTYVLAFSLAAIVFVLNF